MCPAFDLVSNQKRIKFIKYKGDAVRLSVQTPAYVDEVILSLKDNPDLKKKITTFRNSDGEVIERAFDYFDKPYKNKIYSRVDNVIGQDEFVKSTTVKDFILNKDALDIYKDVRRYKETSRFILWANTKTETNHVSENIVTGEKVHSQVRINRGKYRNKLYHTFTEFPHIINNKIAKGLSKVLSFSVNTKTKNYIKNSVKADLVYRALPIEDLKQPLSKHFISKRGLDDMEITIKDNYNPINEKNTNFKAIFDSEDGVVKFNKDYAFKSKTELVATSAHETEHAWQFYLQALLNGGGTNWKDLVAEKFGEITDKKLLKEAKEYDDAIKNYTPFWENRAEYRKNKIEKQANKKGQLASKEYDKEGQMIRADFPHIPVELL